MTKREQLHRWLIEQNDWMYLKQVPHEFFGMSKADCSSALIALCNFERAEFRVIGLKQYRGIAAEPMKMGPKPPKELK